MLRTLSIRDVVLIDRLDLDFAEGLTALTGETGAGKSILLDALGLALGQRADAGLVRAGSTQAVVSASFDLTDGLTADALTDLRAILDEHAIDHDDQLILRRVVAKDGKSRAYINDQPVSVGLLKQIAQLLVAIEGQFEQQGLLDAATHRTLLDAFGGHQELRDDLARAWQAWRALDGELRALRHQADQAARDRDYLTHAVAALRVLDPKPGEEEELVRQRQTLMQRERIMETLGAVYADLEGGDGAKGATKHIADAMRRLDRGRERLGDDLAPVMASLDRAAQELAEAVSGLDRIRQGIESGPKNLEEIEDRLFSLRDQARKHQVTVDGLAQLCATLETQLDAIDQSQGRIAQLTEAERQARETYRTRALALGRARTMAAARLDKAVNAELPPLKLDRARFAVRLERVDELEWAEHGMDRVAFEVATNPGALPGPIGRIASGGELSRFMLAIKVVLAAADPVPTLIFDEVDSGIGGATAAAVGDRLALLAQSVQILVVTHSPQVAARARYHVRVEKSAQQKSARTGVTLLSDGDRREEIARMLSGADITDAARAAADQLLSAGTPPAKAKRKSRVT